jgi:uncharacterized protein YdaU (DUF1376 family)
MPLDEGSIYADPAHEYRSSASQGDLIASRMNYYNFHIGDYAVHTRHLSLLEDLAYRRCLDLYYTREVALPADHNQVARLIGMREHAEDVLSVLREFFVPCEEGSWIHFRCESEIAKATAKAAIAKANGKKGGRPASPPEPEETQRVISGIPDETGSQPPNTQYPIPNTQEEKHASHVPALPEEERPVKKSIPDCPHQEILALWEEVLPALPQHLPSQWKGTRADHLRARWKETAAEKGWVEREEGLAYFRKFFGYVGKSPFLSGRIPPRDGKRQFAAELEWVVSPTNWAKIHEGKYHQE